MLKKINLFDEMCNRLTVGNFVLIKCFISQLKDVALDPLWHVCFADHSFALQHLQKQ